ncbi:protein-glutamate methylesterase/protein-glutamine glutaminase [Leptospira sp. 'Mane']|uniref:protein-glutamate methylesterase/protein-glutamine glutaminase n=1 Tax=Leptospira sp. 'Mane' TaxID=3387407 RepID=UPI00398B4AB2
MTVYKALIVDDQKSVRSMIRRWIESDPNWKVVAEASNPFEARDRILETNPDVMTLDVHMPEMDGIEFLKKLLPQYPLPVIMFSSHTTEGASTTFEALEAGAFDFLAKPSGTPESLEETKADLLEKLNSAIGFNVQSNLIRNTTILKAKPKQESIISYKRKFILIGSSTGGTNAIRTVLSSFNENMPATLIVQHMPQNFTLLFAKRLKSELGLEIREAQNHELIQSGTVFIAPGDFHLTIQKIGTEYFTKLTKAEKQNGHRPSVDALFESAEALKIADQSVGAILTGMGGDGAKGLLKLKNSGCLTVGQNKDTSVVYGMPRVAFEMGAVGYQLPLDQIGEKIKALAQL